MTTKLYHNITREQLIEVINMIGKKKRRKHMPYYEVTGEQLVHAMSMTEDKKNKVKKKWWRRVRRGEIISAETVDRYSTNCQCNIDPTHCPIHGR